MTESGGGEEEGFLGRWSRLKRQSAAAPEEEAAAAPAVAEAGPAPPPGPEPPGPSPFDPASLPPVESLGADSDYRPFMAPEVPAALRRLALRRAWTSNPAIAGFRGLADYDWDCNAPGYGRLLPGDDLQALCERILRGAGEADDAAPAAAPAVSAPVEAERVAGREGGPEDGPAASSSSAAATAGS